MQMNPVAGISTELGEGPLWDAARGCLWCVDIMRGHVHRYTPSAGTDRVYEVGQPVGAVACRERGDLLLALRDGFASMDVDSGTVAMIAPVEQDKPRNRMNDGYVDARGRFWAGTMSMHREREAGALYCLAPDGTVSRHLTGVTTSNGIDWSGDNTRMYYVDTGVPRIDVFDFDLEHGTIVNRRPFVTVDAAAGKPDGLVVDDEDHVWLALWNGGRVQRYAPDGTLVLTVTLPTPLTTKPAFGGSNLSDLYVTTAFIELSTEQRTASPLAGSLFVAPTGYRGRAPRVAR